MMHLLFVETNTTGTGTKAMKIAKQLGYKIHFWTMDLEQYKSMTDDHPLNFADRVVIIDTYDTERMKEEMVRSEVNFSGILAFDDYHLIPVAELASYLGVRGHDIEALKRARYKHIMRNYIKNKKIRYFLQPNFHIIHHPDEVINLEISFPCVIKPVDDSGSNGVTICQNRCDLELSLREEWQRQRNERGYVLERKWLIEEWIEGQEFSAEMLYTIDGWKLISVTKKETYGSHAVECGHVTGPKLNPFYDLEERCKRLLNLLGLNYGAAHIEFFVRGNNLYLVEVNPRLAGDCIPELVELATGVDMIRHVVLQSIGKYEETVNTRRRYAAIKFILPVEQGIYQTVRGMEEAQKVAGVKRISIGKLPFKANEIKSSYQRLGFVIAEGDSMENAIASIQEAMDLLEWGIVHE
ncbi:biotin carboxylase [Anoxybacillus tengchongensis]|uniref:Biotin carboxylase n=1 Tax=Anoxybacillus tengchongensis TaxID=576944 RepID=A0A7W9YNW5_9BACL|nr:ATP-grasp domain-containing protein [Anoxybacillus tengchongensis]MBB6175470.1 biotin carboxylase [Anoxybacillus tengchongensis]